MKKLSNFVNGKSVDSTSGETTTLVNPATGQPFATAPKSNAADIDAAYKAANDAFPDWRDSTPSQRQRALLKIADAIEERAESLEDINKILESACLKIQGFELVTTDLPPDLDSPCGRYFRYRDFFHCGETQLKTQVANLPKEVASYRAYYLLATHILDPLIDYYGPIKLTYGFCGDKLRSLIKKRVSHDRDQHASFEKKIYRKTNSEEPYS